MMELSVNSDCYSDQVVLEVYVELHADNQKKLEELEDHLKQLVGFLDNIGFIWPGTINRRYLTCGRAYCACKTDPDKRHGPYPYWTTKISNKTVSRKLSDEEADILEQWIENRRYMESIIEKMKHISHKALPLVLELRKNE